jgi:hypothetical protein
VAKTLWEKISGAKGKPVKEKKDAKVKKST